MWLVAGLGAAGMGFLGLGVLAFSLRGRLRLAGVLSILLGAACLVGLAFAT